MIYWQEWRYPLSWINLCAARYRLRDELADDEFEDGETCEDPPAAAPILLRCAVVDDMDRLARNAAVILESYRKWEADLVSGKRKPTSLLVLQEYLTLSVLLGLIGEADRGLITWAARFPFGSDREDEAMARVVAMLDGSSEPGGLEEPEGHTEDPILWPRIAMRTPVSSLLDLAACPTHEFWHRLQYWMAPVAAACAAASEVPLAELLRWGRHHDAGDRVRYERAGAPPEEGPRGFDAVIDTPNGMAGCYDLSMVDFYHTPEDLAGILGGAEQDWAAAGARGTELRVYHDPLLDRIDAADLAEAAQRTKTTCTLHSFLDAP